MNLRHKAYQYAMEFESVYNYSDQYKVKDDPIVWRYMSIEKLEDLLKNKALFFAKPSAFIDPLEGSYSYWDVRDSDRSDLDMVNREFMREIQSFSAISCWHINDYESAGMWDLYLGGQDGIAIKTSYSDLIDSITDLRYRIFDGKLQYIDFRKEMTSNNIYDTLFYKRKSFSHENELRLMVIASRIDGIHLETVLDRDGIPYYDWQEKMDELEEQSYNFSHDMGTLVSCNLNKMINEVYVSPKSSMQIVEKVKFLMLEHGFTTKKVIQSDLYKDFIY